jgi:hypothetical protein
VTTEFVSGMQILPVLSHKPVHQHLVAWATSCSTQLGAPCSSSIGWVMPLGTSLQENMIQWAPCLPGTHIPSSCKQLLVSPHLHLLRVVP